mgnify:CR=1 FL=1
MLEDFQDLIDPSQFGLRVAAATIGATALAASVATMIPYVVDKILPPPRQDALFNYLNLERVMPDRKTVKCKDGTWFRTISMTGADITLASDQAREDLFNARKTFVDELERYGILNVKFFHMKERIDLKRDLKPRQENAKKVDEIWETTFPNAYALRHFAVISVKAKTYEEACGLLDQAETFGLSQLSSFKAKVLEEPEDGIPGFDLDAGAPLGPLAPLARSISPLTRPNPLGHRWRGPLGALVTADDIDFSRIKKGTIKFRHGEKVLYACVMTWRDCGEKTAEGVMRDVLAVDCEMNVYHAIEPISQARAIISLNRGKMASVGEHLSLNAASEYDEVLYQVEGNKSGSRASLCFYAMHIMPFAESEKELAKIQSQITAVMTRTAGTVVRLGPTAQPTMMSTVMNDQIWPRKFRFLSTNVAANLYPQRSQTGMISSDWSDEPLAWFRTVSGDPYPFQFHSHSGKGAPGHTLLIGPTGSGKTSLLTFLASQSMRVPELRIFLLDRLNGMKIFTNCAGGRYIAFEGDAANASLNPFHLPDSPENRKFLQRWLRMLAATDDNQSDQEISRAIQILYQGNQPMENRSLRMLSRAAFSPIGMVRKNMELWTNPQSYGNFFNAPRDTLDLETSRVTAFDMTTILTDEKLAPPMISYVTHRIKNLSMTTTHPTLVIVDETGPMLKNKVFSHDFLQVGLQEGRKLRQAFVLCFQSPQGVENTGMAQIIMDQCQTWIFFRNNRESEEAAAAYAPYGLNNAEIDFITGKTFPEKRYSILIKRANSNDSAIVDVDLSRLGKYLKMFESDTRQVAALDQLMEIHPRDEAVKRYLG